ncbi:nitroreductase [Micromonospora sp. BRA006-A]|nr:nitroreductase [Micromonospora sp. BRA006-A]
MNSSSTRTEQNPRVRVLEAAARQSLHAPSVFNTQPWRWRVTGDALELRADADRQLAHTDPDGRLLILSRGAALHHARVSLTAVGWAVTVERLPDPADPSLLARVRTTGPADLDVPAGRLVDAIPRRRTDRRACGPAGAGGGAGPARGRRGGRGRAPARGPAGPDADARRLHRSRRRRGAGRPRVPGGAAPLDPPPGGQRRRGARRHRRAAVPRRVPLRDYGPRRAAGLSAGADFDRGAAYLILFGESDEPAAWLRGGEALSALLLTATAEGWPARRSATPWSWPGHAG